jgi:hypothetical protein
MEAGANRVFPLLLWQPDALERFISEAPGPVNALKSPGGPYAGYAVKLRAAAP